MTSAHNLTSTYALHQRTHYAVTSSSFSLLCSLFQSSEILDVVTSKVKFVLERSHSIGNSKRLCKVDSTCAQKRPKSLHVLPANSHLQRCRNEGNAFLNRHARRQSALRTSIVSSLRPKTLKHEILYGCYSLCFNVIWQYHVHRNRLMLLLHLDRL
jgi:hypothetical protein